MGRVGTVRQKKKNVLIKTEHVTDLSMFSYKADTLTVEGVNAVIDQLQYLPMNIVEIGAFEGTGNIPAVAILYPLNANDKIEGNYYYAEGLKPFPTTCWLTNPTLHTQISALEERGCITELYDRLHSSRENLDRMVEAHKAYASFRWSMLSEEHIEYLKDKGWESTIKDVGIAGMKTFDAVKCLHCHYAHYLAKPEHNNIIGKWVSELLLNEMHTKPI